MLKKKHGRVKQYSSIDEFKAMDEVAMYLDCKFIKQEASKQDGIEYNIYLELPQNVVTNKNNNRNFYENLIQYSAHALQYKNFAIIDEKNNANILVYCEEEEKMVKLYSIDGVINYFDKVENDYNMNNFKTVDPIDIEITSDVLNKIINNKWQLSGLDLGTQESTFRGYDIYFDEGYNVKRTDGKVFNIVFTEKFNANVIDNLNVKSSRDEVMQKLGRPQFEAGNLIGYKSNKIYVFFYENQISVYRVENYNNNDLSQIIQEYNRDGDHKRLIDQMRSTWTDYDVFEYGSDYEKLQYTLRGICIKFDSTTKKGFILYNNYNGAVYGNVSLSEMVETKQQLPENVFVENEDLVFATEKNRVNTLDDTTSNYNYITDIVANISAKYKTHTSSTESNEELFKVRFISINNEFPNSELREPITSGIWYNDEIFIYSVKNIGIYSYNATTHIYSTIVTGTEDYKIKKIRDNILFYDENAIEFNL